MEGYAFRTLPFETRLLETAAQLHGFYTLEMGVEARHVVAFWGLFPKEVVECHFGLDDTGMLVALQTISRHVCEMYGLSCSRSFPEQLFSFSCMAVFTVLDFVLGRSELHFAKINYAVFPVNQKIDLRPIVFRSPRNLPGTVVGYDAGDSKRNFDLPDMLKAESLERKTLPDSAELRIG